MGFRFRRSIKILPGIRLNLSRSGVSASVGVRGAHVTVGHGKVRETVGLPGTGISYTHVEGATPPNANPPDLPADEWGAMPKPIGTTPLSIDRLQVVCILGVVAFIAFLVYMVRNR